MKSTIISVVIAGSFVFCGLILLTQWLFYAALWPIFFFGALFFFLGVGWLVDMILARGGYL